MGAGALLGLAELSPAARARDPEGGAVHGDAAVRAATAGVRPVGERSLAAVMVLARGQLEDTLDGD